MAISKFDNGHYTPYAFRWVKHKDRDYRIHVGNDGEVISVVVRTINERRRYLNLNGPTARAVIAKL